MTIPGERIQKPVFIEDPANPGGATGLAIGDVTSVHIATAYGADVADMDAYSASASLTEVDAGSFPGWYNWSFLAPSSAGYWAARLTHASFDIAGGFQQDETENRDRDKLFGTLSRPSATLSDSVQLGSAVPLTLAARRYRQFSITITAIGGGVYDLSSHGNWRMAVRKADGTAVWESGTGSHKITGFALTGDANGIVTATIPEDVYQATAWQASTAYVVGDVVQGTTAGDPCMICTVAGTSAGSEPAWNATAGASVSDNDVTWRTLDDFFALINAVIADGNSEENIRYEITADESGDASKTVPVVRSSTLTLTRFEVGGLNS